MFQDKSGRDAIPIEHRAMMHAVIASWGSVDPYCQSGACLVEKDAIRAIACSTLVGDNSTYMNNFKLTWDTPKIYDYLVPAEIKVLDELPKENTYFDWTIFVSTIPRPESVVRILERGIRKIVYGPKRPYGLPKDYKKTFDHLAHAYHTVKIERYSRKLHWALDKLAIMEIQVPEFFS
jgi:hypothetical protein